MPSVDWQLLFLHAITGACTPVCLSAASTSVEAVTPPFWQVKTTGGAHCAPLQQIKELISFWAVTPQKSIR